MDLRADLSFSQFRRSTPSRYFSVQLCDGNTYNFGYIGSAHDRQRRGRLHGGRAGLERTVPATIKRVFRSSTQFSLAALSAPNSSTPRDIDNVIKVQDGYKAAAAFRLSATAAPPAAAPAIDFPKFDKELAKTSFFDFLDFALEFAAAGALREPRSAPSLRASASDPGRRELQGPLRRAQAAVGSA